VGEVPHVNYFILNHNLSWSIFDKYSKCRLLKAAESFETRFASNIIMAKRFLDVNEALENGYELWLEEKNRINEKSPIELGVEPVEIH